MGEIILHTLAGLVRLIFEVLIEFFFFQLGRGTLLLATLGRYPRGKALERHTDRITLIGLLTAAGLVGGVALWVG